MEKCGVMIINSSKIYGGTEKWCMLAGSELKRRGYPVFIAHRHPIIGEVATEFGLPGYRLSLKNDADVWSLLRLVFFIKKTNVGVVISTKPREYWLGTVAARMAGVISYLRLGIVRPLQNKWKNRKIWGNWSRRIIVNSTAIQSVLLESGFVSSQKVTVIYNGVEIPEELSAFQSHPSNFRFIFIGNLLARKKVDILLKAYKNFLQEMPAVTSRLWIVGDGPERKHLENMVQELRIESNVVFWGFRRDVRKILSRAHVFLFLSESEGIPNALLEALATGVVPIVNQFEGVQEVIEHGVNGLLVDQTNADEITGAMIELVRNEELRRTLRERGFEMVKDRFSITVMGDQLEKVIEEDLHEN